MPPDNRDYEYAISLPATTKYKQYTGHNIEYYTDITVSIDKLMVARSKNMQPTTDADEDDRDYKIKHVVIKITKGGVTEEFEYDEPDEVFNNAEYLLHNGQYVSHQSNFTGYSLNLYSFDSMNPDGGYETEGHDVTETPHFPTVDYEGFCELNSIWVYYAGQNDTQDQVWCKNAKTLTVTDRNTSVTRILDDSTQAHRPVLINSASEGEIYDLTDSGKTADDIWSEFVNGQYEPPEVTAYNQTIVFLPPIIYGEWDHHTIYYYITGPSNGGGGTKEAPLTYRDNARYYDFDDVNNIYVLASDHSKTAKIQMRSLLWTDQGKQQIGRDLNMLNLDVANAYYILANPERPSDFSDTNQLIFYPPFEVNLDHPITSQDEVEVSSNNVVVTLYKLGTTNEGLSKEVSVNDLVKNFNKLTYNIQTHTYIIYTTDGQSQTEITNKLLDKLGIKPFDTSKTTLSLSTMLYQRYKLYVFEGVNFTNNKLENSAQTSFKHYSPDTVEAAEEDVNLTRSTAKSNAEFIRMNRSSLMTPDEYYTDHSTSTIVTDADNGYDRKENSNTFNGVPKYFWVETIKNWCIFKKAKTLPSVNYSLRYYDTVIKLTDRAKDAYRRRAWEMYVWDGFGGWVNFNRVLMNYHFKSTNPGVDKVSIYELGELTSLANTCSDTTMYYDFSRFKYISNFRIDCNRNNTTKWRDEGIPDRTPTWVVARGIILTNDRDYSTIDTSTCQTIRISKTYARYHKNGKNNPKDNWQTGQQCYAAGCPMIWRLSSGELFLACDWQLDGNYDNDDVYHSDILNDANTDFINQCARSFFGTGSDKTIEKDWRNFDYHDDSEERASAFLSSDSDETLLAGKAAFAEFNEFVDHATIRVKSNRSRVNGTTNFTDINTLTRW